MALLPHYYFSKKYSHKSCLTIIIEQPTPIINQIEYGTLIWLVQYFYRETIYFIIFQSMRAKMRQICVKLKEGLDFSQFWNELPSNGSVNR